MEIWREGKKNRIAFQGVVLFHVARPISEGPFKFLMSTALVYFIHIL